MLNTMIQIEQNYQLKRNALSELANGNVANEEIFRTIYTDYNARTSELEKNLRTLAEDALKQHTECGEEADRMRAKITESQIRNVTGEISKEDLEKQMRPLEQKIDELRKRQTALASYLAGISERYAETDPQGSITQLIIQSAEAESLLTSPRTGIISKETAKMLKEDNKLMHQSVDYFSKEILQKVPQPILNNKPSK